MGYTSFHAAELAGASVLVVQPGTALQLSNRRETELRLFIVGAPPERGETVFLDPRGLDRYSAPVSSPGSLFTIGGSI